MARLAAAETRRHLGDVDANTASAGLAHFARVTGGPTDVAEKGSLAKSAIGKRSARHGDSRCQAAIAGKRKSLRILYIGSLSCWIHLLSIWPAASHQIELGKHLPADFESRTSPCPPMDQLSNVRS